MLTQIRECRSQRNLRALKLKFEKYNLVICEELGYINFDKEGSQLLFNHLSLRAGKKATIITTNLSFDKWTEIFNNPVITAAIVDRLAHKAYMVNTTGNSFRFFETNKDEKSENIISFSTTRWFNF
ncbi:MAG: ATP-binding protein [Marinifilaceae bacterium]